MNIVCVHLHLSAALTELGHTVRELNLPPGLVRLGPHLGSFQPDLLIQQETLGPRTVILDLGLVSCPKVFWSIDTHLNSFWHRYYGRLFDLVCSTQQHWLPWLQGRDLQAVWLPWSGVQRPTRSWEGRRALSFVGRVTPERPVRGWFLDLLATQDGFEAVDGLAHAAMLDRYDRTKIVPNESIFGEINFRLFEAASCGCAVVNPDIPGLDELFAPGEEVAVYRDGAELVHWLGRLRAGDVSARLMGARARSRVLRDHLPRQRAQSLLDQALLAAPKARVGVSGDISLWLALYRLWEAGRLGMSAQEMEQAFFSLPADEEVLAVLLRLRAAAGRDAFMQLAAPVLANGQYVESPLVNLAGSMGALRHDDPATARLFFLRHQRWAKLRTLPPGEGAVSICLAWAGELQRLGEAFRPGFTFNPARHLPESALECLVLASEMTPHDREIYRSMDRLLERTAGWESLRLQAMSYLGLRERDNWRLGMRLGVTNCQAFRVTQGVEELLAALETARRQGEEKRFWTMLDGMDRSGRIGFLVRADAGLAITDHNKGEHA